MPILPGVKFPSAASRADSPGLNIVITVILDVIKEFSQGRWGEGGHVCAPVLVCASGNAVGIPVGTMRNGWRHRTGNICRQARGAAFIHSLYVKRAGLGCFDDQTCINRKM